MNKRTTILLGLLAIGAMVSLLAYPAVAGKDQNEQSGHVAKRACGAGSAEAVAASDGKSCPARAGNVMASADGTKSCGTAAVASKAGKSCPAGQMAGILASADDKAEGRSCGSCKKAKSCGDCDKAKSCGGCKQAAKGGHGELSAALEKLDAVEAAVKSGDKDAALKALAGARKALRPMVRRSEAALATVEPAQGKAHKDHEHKARYVNSSCPIMGSPIQPASVKPHLVRQYKGQAVAFCCGGCPDRWDKLSAEQKAAKLSKAK